MKNSITLRCGLPGVLEHRDSVMVDRGFDIEEDLALQGAKLKMPPLTGKKNNLVPLHELVGN